GVRMRIGIGFGVLLLSIAASTAWAGCGAVFDQAPKLTDDFSRLLQRAEHGDRTAQFRVAVAYEAGVGTERDYSEAVRWYRLAGDAGRPEAQNNLGSMYGRGLGVTKNDAEAMKWYLRAASAGHPAAQNNVGSLYGAGHGVPQDDAQAVYWYRKSADQ